MLIQPQTIEMKWHQRYRSYYEEKGYEFTNYGDIFKVSFIDLPKKCNKKILVYCDYCLTDGVYKQVEKTFQDYSKQNESAVIKKDCCYDCRPKKVKESNLMVYGKESTNQVDSIRQKQKETNFKRYGFENVMKNQAVQEKVINTNIERFGTKAPAQNEGIKNKIKNTNMIRYGHVSPTLDNQVREKQKVTMIKKYGVEYGMQNEDILKKAKHTLYQNGTAPVSRQQLYVWNVIGGELNYPYKNYSLDIAQLEKKLYIECDFGGHWLQIKLGNKTRESFVNDERKRYYALSRKGWKVIRIISRKDKVPSVKKIKELMEYAKSYLNNHSWVHFDLDKGLVINRTGEVNYDFGELFYVYQIKSDEFTT
ncbi:hypothetical protein [Bacillus sp. OAE603]|uniref:DUF7487 domain-containing protein n=1 Tax=Gottfriedia sp. OAE603 TaxID=2663872 RepID=UPI001788F9AF